MIDILVNSLVPIFAVMGIGYFAGWIRDVDNHHVAELNALVMDFALPASLFVATATTSRAMLLAQWPLLVTLIVSMLLLYGLCYWAQRRLFGLRSGPAAVQTLTIALPNYAAAGLPLISAVFGADHTIYVALAIAAGSIFPSPLTLAILEANKAAEAGQQKNVGAIVGAIGRSLRKPIVLGPAIGILFSLAGIPLATVVVHSLQLIGQTAGGVALFLTGVILSAQKLVLSRNVISGVLLKNVVHPLIAFALVLLLSLHGEAARAAILLAALPSGFFGVLFGLRYGVESREAGSTLVVSSVFSIVTLAAVLILTAGM
jgi:malonate transporter